jgi:hypothetical protein
MHSDGHSHDDHLHSDDEHYKGALKGLGALIGLYMFFLGEKLMQLKRSKKEQKVFFGNIFVMGAGRRIGLT